MGYFHPISAAKYVRLKNGLSLLLLGRKTIIYFTVTSSQSAIYLGIFVSIFNLKRRLLMLYLTLIDSRDIYTKKLVG